MDKSRQSSWMRWMLLGMIAATFVILAPEAQAVDVSYKTLNVAFHGYFEADIILRDVDGLQRGFFNQTELVQQRNTLKFDVDVHPEWSIGEFSLDKFHFTYRGAYDSIYDLRNDEYADIRKEGGPSKFDLGKNDLRWENDLREISFDLVYNGSLGTCFVRPGRQIISWGETQGVTIIDMINPSDNSFQMFFLNPDDLKIPLWMVRVNYSLPPLKFLNLNVDGLYIPEIRPPQFAPLDASMQAPYVRILPFAGLAAAGVTDIRYDVPTDNTGLALRVTADVGANLSVSGVYVRHLGPTPGLSLSNLKFNPALSPPIGPSSASLSFFMTETYGGFFNYYLEFLDIVLQGEFGRTNNEPLALPATEPDTVGEGLLPEAIVTYRMKPVIKWMLGFGKDLKFRWFSEANIMWAVQWIHTRHEEWEEVYDHPGGPDQDEDLFVNVLVWYWFHSKINPMLLVMADPRENFVARLGVTWTISKEWYANGTIQSFWGDRNSTSAFAGFVDGPTELTFKVGYQW